MNIQALRYIIEIEHTGSINKASQHLYVSQSSLSRAIKEVEAQIGIALFHRTNKGVVATHDGKKFIEHPVAQILFFLLLLCVLVSLLLILYFAFGVRLD